MAVQILIYEDNDALRKGLEQLLMLSNEFQVIQTSQNCLQADTDVKSLQPDVVLMDIDMPEMTGIEALKKIRLFDKKVAIIMLTVFEDDGHVFDAICAGASGYLLKKNVSEKLVPAILEVMNGGAPMSATIAKMVINSMHKKTVNEYNFTPKENEILKLLCKGLSYKMIAAQTGLAFETIRSYIKNIYEKLQVHSATEAVSKAINEKLV